MTCFHCGATAPPFIANQICLECTADATLDRNLFAQWRYLQPSEAAGVGDERREHRLSKDWKIILYDFQPVGENDHGCYRRRVTMADTAKRYLDPGEPLRVGDWARPENEVGVTASEYIPIPEDAPVENMVVAEELTVIRRLYAKFPPTTCLCTPDARAPLVSTDEEPKASVCTTCGRIWADLQSAMPDLEITPEAYARIAQRETPCPCDDFVRIMPHEKSITDEVRNFRAIIRGEELPPPIRMECKECGLIWSAAAWHARKSPYPDMLVHDRTVIKHALRSFATGPRQLFAQNRYLLKAQEHRWKSRLRKGVLAGLGKAAVEAIDKEFENAGRLLQERWSPSERRFDGYGAWHAVDPVLAEDTIALVDYVTDTLSGLEEVFAVDIKAAYNARTKVLDDALILHGGKAFFFPTEPPSAEDHDAWWEHVETRPWNEAAWGPRPQKPPVPPLPAGPEGHALVEIADLLRPVYAFTVVGEGMTAETARLAAEDAPVKLVLQVVGNTPGPILEKARLWILAQTTLARDCGQTLALLSALTKLTCPFEDSFVDIPPDLSDLPEAVSTTAPPSHESLIERPPCEPIHVLEPGADIREGDYWGDEGTFRPCVYAVGKTVPLFTAPQVPEFDEEGVPTGDYHAAVQPPAVFFRAIDTEWKRASGLPDPYRERVVYERLCDPAVTESTETPVDAVTDTPKVGTIPELESTLKALYEAVGMPVETFTVDRQHRVVRLVLKTGRTIAVPLPPGIE